MGKASVRENKNLYFQKRESLGLTRDKASELLESIPPERIEKIENERSLAHPDEILIMADKYKAPELCNYYCARECPIGRRYVPEVRGEDLSKTILSILASLNAMQKKQERLIEITADGAIAKDEVADFYQIQSELEKISVMVENLQLWTERMLAHGEIDEASYQKAKAEKEVNKR